MSELRRCRTRAIPPPMRRNSAFYGRERLASLTALVIATWIGAAAPAWAGAGDDLAFFTHIDHVQLANGLEVYLHEDHRAPFVAVSIWYHVGYRDDTPGRLGLAHLFEHLMFEGSAHIPVGHKWWLPRLKAFSANALTSLDRTDYFETVPSANLEAALWLESDRMGFVSAGFDPAALDRAREAVRHEREENVDSRAYAVAVQRFRSMLYTDVHPYGRPANGSDRELDGILLSDVRAFRAKWYLPANATLVLVGDFTIPQAKALVHKYFETLPGGSRPPMPALALGAQERESILHQPESLGNLTILSIGWRSPAFFASDDAAGDVLADVLTGDPSSRLGRQLNQNQHLTFTTRARQVSHPVLSHFEISLVLQPGVDPQRAMAALDAELGDLGEKGPTQEELAAALARRQLRFVRGLDGVAGLARIADLIQLYNQSIGDPSGILRDRARYQAVTAEDVRRFVRNYLDRRRRVVLIADPIARARPNDLPILPDDSEGDK